MKHLGIFPGTFDPIHEGHIHFAEAARVKFGLDSVTFLPEASPRYKQNITGLGKRVQYIRSQIADRKQLDVLRLQTSPFEVKSTLSEIEKHYPAASFSILIGSDVAQGLPTWKDVGYLLDKCELIIGLRDSAEESKLSQLLKPLGNTSTIHIIESPFPSHKSSDIKLSN